MDWLELYWTDVYKTSHYRMLPPGSLLMYSNLTARSGKYANVPDSKGIVSMGQQMTMRKMKEDWQKNFFDKDVEEIHQFGRDMTAMLMLKEPYNVSHFLELHELGYLPIRVKSLEEGTFIPYRVPMLTIVNTRELSTQASDFITNYLETILSAESWQSPTSATVGLAFKRLGKEWIMKTDPTNLWILDYMFHDFSMRGMAGKSSIVNSAIGFAATSRGSDTLPVIPAARKYYDEVDVCINSVLATEHAIMCTLTGFFLKKNDGTWENIGAIEVEAFRELLRRFPTGILSIVSDTWDLWRVLTEYMVILKDEILARDGKLVIRPDSGDPVDIITGHTEFIVENGKYYTLDNRFMKDSPIADKDIPACKGVIELLWDVFGGTTNEQGYKVLNPKVGAIYGDSINLDRAKRIFERLEKKGFAVTCVVFGVGSFSLQFVTRDTHGIAQKATYVEIELDGERVGIEIFKDPVTDDGVKKSARGLMRVDRNILGDYILKDQCTWEEEQGGYLQTIFENGELFNQTTLTAIRARVAALA